MLAVWRDKLARVKLLPGGLRMHHNGGLLLSGEVCIMCLQLDAENIAGRVVLKKIEVIDLRKCGAPLVQRAVAEDNI